MTHWHQIFLTKRKKLHRNALVLKANVKLIFLLIEILLANKLQHIPVAFARTYFTRKHDDVILQDLDGKTWSVHYKVYENNYETHFLHGWKGFAQYHNLKVGDTCAFELLEGLEISLRVTMFRDAEDANDHLTAGE